MSKVKSYTNEALLYVYRVFQIQVDYVKAKVVEMWTPLM